jgi:hypothetical protein
MMSNWPLQAGALIGAGVATAATGGAAAVGAVAAVGSAGALMATKRGCSRNRSAILNATNQIIASAVIKSLVNCNTTRDSSQNIEIKCAPVMPPGATYDVYEGNPACTSCVRDVFQGMLDQHKLERAMWKKGEIKVRQPINEEYVLLLSRVGTCGLTACKACTMANVTQSNILTSNDTCVSNLSTSTTFKSNLTALINQQMTNNQDILSAFATKLGDSDATTILTTVSNTILANLGQTFLQDMADALKSSQTIEITSNGTTSLNNISQINVFKIVVEELSKNNSLTESINGIYDQYLSDIDNEQQSLNSVGDLVFDGTVTFVSAIDNVVGQVMFASIAVLTLLILSVIFYSIYKFFAKLAKTASQRERMSHFATMQKAVSN